MKCAERPSLGMKLGLRLGLGWALKARHPQEKASGIILRVVLLGMYMGSPIPLGKEF